MKRRLNVMLSERIVKAMDERANIEKISRSNFIERAVYNALKEKRKAELDELAAEGYALYAEENEREAEEGMADWVELQKDDPWDWGSVK